MFPSQPCCSSTSGQQQQQQQCCCPADAPTEQSEALQILCQFEKMYEGRIKAVESDCNVTDAQRTELKLKIMTDWVKDLGEQNTLLVQTVHDLEQAAVCRVKLLENKLQETSNLISHNMLNSDKSEEDLCALSNRICELEKDQDNMKKRIGFLQCDIGSLLKLIKRGRLENNWNLDEITFYEIQPSDIPAPADCTCGQENGDAENSKTACYVAQLEDNEKKLLSYQSDLEDKVSELTKQVHAKDNINKKYVHEIENLRDSLNNRLNNNLEKISCCNSSNINFNNDIISVIDKEENNFETLCNTEAKMDKLMHEYSCKMNELQMNIEEKCKENECLVARLACLEKESLESRDALAAEVAQKHDTISVLKNQILCLKEELQKSEAKLLIKKEAIQQMKSDLKTATCPKVPTRRVRIITEPCQELEDKTIQDRLHDTTKQLEEFKSLLVIKDNEISQLRTIISEKSNQAMNRTDNSPLHNASTENESELLAYLTKLKSSTENDKEIILSLKIEYETVLKKLAQIMNTYEKDVALANEMLLDMKSCLHNYRSEVIKQDQNRDNMSEFITIIESKIIHIQKLFQNNCEMCVKENLLSEIKQIISKVTCSIQSLSEVYENKNKTVSSIGLMIIKSSAIISNKNTVNEFEQKAIFAAILKQFRMMEEFRICTVEVQAATEDLREEVSAVISNLNSRHRKYIELAKIVSQVQDYLTRTRENVSEVINCLELQDEERTRHSERITNNRIRLKDIKNEFNQTQSELSKCLNNVQNNIQQTSSLGYKEIHTCNDLLISVAEEVEQLVCNLHAFQTQGYCSLSTMTELRKQLTDMEHNVKELKKKTEVLLLENEAAQMTFIEKSKRLEKYECEVDNCHTKMQDVLESIIATRDQMNEFGCIKKETEVSFQSTNETIKMKDELRRLHKECEELKLKIVQESRVDKQDKIVAVWENRVIDLQDQIKVLQSDIKCKTEANIFLKQSIESLEKELDSVRAKAEDYRRCSSAECLELKKKNFELENSLRVQKDTENNLKCLTNNETDSKKSQLLEYFNKERLYDVTLKHGLQGTHENVPQLFTMLQDTIQVIKNGLQELGDELKRLVSEGSSHTYCSTKDSVRAAIEILAKYVESIKYCSFEVEKIKAALYSKDKLMENMDEIIRIQKDSITISQSELEDLHKTLDEKINGQEKAISQYEKEKRQLKKQIELQVQTIGHLQDAVVEAKRTIDQLSHKAASDNFNKSRTMRSLRLYITETESQYSDCFGEASEQAALLELQRDAISALQKKISFLECDEFLNAFMLHFVYYVILFKYQMELESQTQKCATMKLKMNEALCKKNATENRWCSFQCKYQASIDELERLRDDLENSCKELCEKQRVIDELIADKNDMKNELQVYKFDFDLLTEEMKKMGISDMSMKCFKIELEAMRSDNEQFRCELERCRKIINELQYANECLTMQLREQSSKDVCLMKYKENMFHLQNEISLKSEKIKSLKERVCCADKVIDDQLKLIEEQNIKILCNAKELRDFSHELESYKETKCVLQAHNDTLKGMIVKLRQDRQILKNSKNSLAAELCVLTDRLKKESHVLKQTHCQLLDKQKNLEKVSRELEQFKDHVSDLLKKHASAANLKMSNSETCKCSYPDARNEDKKNKEMVTCLNRELEEFREKYYEAQAKFNTLLPKYENSERSCQRQKDDIILLERDLAILRQKYQSCTDKNVDLQRQNKLHEDNVCKCMAELDDIVLQLEDMQSSLVELRAECDRKTQSLDSLSIELAKMKVSRSEVCQESKYVLELVRFWMREQKQTVSLLQKKLYDKQQLLLRISCERKNSKISRKRLKRTNSVLEKKSRTTLKPAIKQQTAALPNGCSLPTQQCHKSSVKQKVGLHNGFYAPCSRQEKSEASVSHFKKECKEGPTRTVDKVTTAGDYKFLPALGFLTKAIPKATQLENTRAERRTHEETTDCGYQTSCSK